jgi:hypothetical protein
MRPTLRPLVAGQHTANPVGKYHVFPRHGQPAEIDRLVCLPPGGRDGSVAPGSTVFSVLHWDA